MPLITDFNLTPLESALLAFTTALYDQKAFSTIEKEEIRDALSSGQICSKMWLVKEFSKVLEKTSKLEKLNIIVVGGWVGLLAHAIKTLDKKIVVESCDIDSRVTYIAGHVLKDSGKATNKNMYDIGYDNYDCIINTSTEHIEDISSWSNLIPQGKWVIAQGNNQRAIKDHIGCVDSAKELSELLKLSEIYYAEELVFPFYTRYMVIGKK